jgi:hypothetical protein
MNVPLLTHIEWTSPRPILFVTGEHARSRYYSEDAYERGAEPKELHIVPNAGHVDLYDKTDLIPFDKLETFFTEAPHTRRACRRSTRRQRSLITDDTQTRGRAPQLPPRSLATL